MLTCPQCGAENRGEARFCDSCGAALAEPTAPREVRKVVTVLFCDVTGSTALGERIDPESLRRVMARYFETAKAIVERHGGTVEKFIGDAVMAVFGVPAVHEDDALRAVRTADELRAGLGELNDELERNYGTRLELRMGVNTGEVVTGTEERLATGDAVNVAARLEQAAAPGEVLLGDETYRLVRAVADTEAVEPIAAKGKAEPLPAYRLLSVRAGDAPRSGEAPMVGRERQLHLLEHAFASASAERSCHLFTILGSAGVGKSRLAEEFLRTLDDAVLVRGRCLSYGEGISYWPVTEVVKQLQPEAPESTPLGSILGDEAAAGSPDEIAWAFRKLLESRAAEHPLVVVFDDVHWGEPAFLDLVEHVADLSRGAPILLLCMARPELLDRRPSWGGGKLNATNVLLEPLEAGEAGELIDSLASEVSAELRRRILEAAEGNPLFVEEMVTMASEDGAEVAVPPTIQALLAARLDQLEPGERSVLERGAVEGLVFHRGAVAALAPDEPPVDGRLVTLVRKDLVRPEPAVLPEDDAYRFRHLLIRDTAYDALPKAVRADLHERFAAWLEEHGAGLVELDEIAGFHLEQAYRYRLELGPLDAATAALGKRAGERLLRGAERADERGDVTAARALFTRGIEMMQPEHPGYWRAQLDLAAVLVTLGDYETAVELAEHVAATARSGGDEGLLARSELVRADASVQSDPTGTMRESMAVVEDALAVLERVGDEVGAVWALRLLAVFKGWIGRGDEMLRLLDGARERAERVSPRVAADFGMWMALAAWWAHDTPVEKGLRMCEDLLASSGSKRVEGVTITVRGVLKAENGQLDEGRADVSAGRALLRDLGSTIWWAGSGNAEGDMELSCGDPRRAYEVLAESRAVLASSAGSGYLSSVSAAQAQAALELGRDDEALELADDAEAVSQADDFDPHARIRIVRARVAARRGDFERAGKLIREVEAILAPTDHEMLARYLAFAKAEVERLAGRPDGERAALEEAVAGAEAKGDLATVERARKRLAEL